MVKKNSLKETPITDQSKKKDFFLKTSQLPLVILIKCHPKHPSYKVNTKTNKPHFFNQKPRK